MIPAASATNVCNPEPSDEWALGWPAFAREAETTNPGVLGSNPSGLTNENALQERVSRRAISLLSDSLGINWRESITGVLGLT